LHIVIAPSDPAFGGVFTETVTVELAMELPQAPDPVTVYDHVPAGSTPGSNVLLCAAPVGSVHVPPAAGVPPS
jgi:hypothetical protein